MFASSQRGITVTDFALPPETTKKQIKYMKYQFLR